MKLTTLTSFAAITGALASTTSPPYRIGGPGRRHHGQSAGADGKNNVQNSWGGAVQEGTNWHHVESIAVIPSVSGQSSRAAASIWAGIDGWSCQTAILQTGIDVFGDGRVEGWYEWWPAPPKYYEQGFTAKAGDTIRMTVDAWTATSGNATLENLTTGHSATHNFNNEAKLCGFDAEWIVEDFGSDYNGNHVPFVNFGEVTFRDTVAKGNRGTVNADGAKIVNVEIDGQYHTNCGSNENGVLCKYV